MSDYCDRCNYIQINFINFAGQTCLKEVMVLEKIVAFYSSSPILFPFLLRSSVFLTNKQVAMGCEVDLCVVRLEAVQ